MYLFITSFYSLQEKRQKNTKACQTENEPLPEVSYLTLIMKLIKYSSVACCPEPLSCLVAIMQVTPL